MPQSVVLTGSTEAGHHMTHGTIPLPGLRSPGLIPGSRHPLIAKPGPGHSLISEPWSGVIGVVGVIGSGVRGGTL